MPWARPARRWKSLFLLASRCRPEGKKSNRLTVVSASELIADTTTVTRLPPLTNIRHKTLNFTTDSQGRVVSVAGKLSLGKGGSYSARLRKEILARGIKKDQTGHLIAKILNGPPERFNLVPQNGNLNMGRWRVMEKGWAKKLKTHDIEIDMRINYPPGSTRPSRFLVDWTETDKITGKALPDSKVFKNAPR